MNSNSDIENEHQDTDVPKIYKSYPEQKFEDMETGQL